MSQQRKECQWLRTKRGKKFKSFEVRLSKPHQNTIAHCSIHGEAITKVVSGMNLRQQALKGVLWSAIQNWGTQAISFLVFFTLARLLDPKSFGLVALAGVFFSFMELFLRQGFANALVQRQELEPEHLDTAFWINLSIGTILMAIAIGFAGPIANWFDQPQLAPILQWMSPSFLLAALSDVQQTLFRRQLAFKALSIRSLVATLVGGVVGVVMALLGFGVWSLVGQRLSNALGGVLVLWWASQWRPGLKFSLSHGRELFSFGMNIMGSQLLTFFVLRADDFLVGKFLGAIELGYYTIAYRVLLTITQLLYSTTNQVVLPTFSRLQEEPERMRRWLYNATKLSSLISLPLCFGIAALAPELVLGLFGKQWLPSVPTMQVLAFVGPMQLSQGIVSSAITAVGKPNWNLKVNFVNATASVVAFAIAVRWGIVAVAVGRVASGYLVTPIRVGMLRRLISIELTTYLYQFATPLVASLAMVASISGAKYLLSDWLNWQGVLAICIPLSAGVYGLILWWIDAELVLQALQMGRSVLSRKKKKQ
ncbi:lipopolysaccharide biosynthesis protein [Phormidium sp. CCY1219]|uniref:lipopolysaccharide biosynthesis protein n=1 Tax=Phormidium sp. CCY1219 TaxID=2886104 RepID=UPI002D1F222E|nr:lipopolysaccharide biosynthesis protein [Phormidium sp. CCY1219]MEB3829844.1 lipopolysaccharide biosynthesis protein [Phormidium sp. CCY1219]